MAVFYHPVLRIGGAERMFINVARHWDMMEIKFRIIEPEPGLLLKSYKLPILVRSSTPWSDVIHGILFAASVVPTALTMHGFNVVLACNNHLLSLLPAVLLSRLKRKPCAVIVHHYDILDEESLSTSLSGIFKIARGMGYGRLYSLLKAFATKIAIVMAGSCAATICVSKVFAELFPNSYVSSNGVNSDLIDSVGTIEKEYEACFVGRLDLKKGIVNLLEAWKTVVDHLPSAKLALVGHDQVGISKLLLKYGLTNNVTYLGVLSDRRMYETVKKSRVSVTMSTAEGWGLAIAEALACGTPVICCRIKTLYEQWKNCPYVFFTEPNNDQQASAKITEVLKMRSVVPQKIKECVKDLSWKDVASKNANIIRGIIRGNNLENTHGLQANGEEMTTPPRQSQ